MARATLVRQLEAVARSIELSCSVKVDTAINSKVPVTLNHGLGVEAVLTSAARVVGADRIEANPRPVMASGDFSRFLEQVPGAFFFVGQDGAFCHHPEFVFDPAIIPAEERRHILPVLPVEERPLRRDERRDPAQESSEGHDIAPE